MPPSAQAGDVALKHAWVAPELRSPSHGTHLRERLSQIGFVLGHWALVTHSTQLFERGSHALVGAAQLLFVGVQGTQLPPGAQAGRADVVHAWVAPLPKSPLHGTQEPASQKGRSAFVHWASDTHSTHLFVVVSHCFAVALAAQSLKSRHSTHACAVTLQRGVGAEQFASVAQPGPHVLLLRLQMPLLPRHCAFDVHSTQSCAESLQTGWAGVHAVRLVPLTALSLHSKHEPVTHAGRS